MVSENEGVGFEGGDDDEEFDMSQVAEDSFEVLPAGTYNVTVDEATAKKSSSGNPMISLQLIVEDGEYEGRKLFTHVVFSPKTMGMAKRTMNRLGLADLTNGPFKPNQEAADQFVGKRAKAVVKVKMYEGEQTNEVKKILPAGSEGGDSSDFLAD